MQLKDAFILKLCSLYLFPPYVARLILPVTVLFLLGTVFSHFKTALNGELKASILKHFAGIPHNQYYVVAISNACVKCGGGCHMDEVIKKQEERFGQRQIYRRGAGDP